MRKTFSTQRIESGFALLLTLIIVSVVLAIGLSILDTTLKQVVLSGTGRDSEKSFHAAYAGAECGQNSRLNDLYTDAIVNSDGNPSITCLGGSQSVDSSLHTNVSGGRVHRLTYDITWGPSNETCTNFDLYLFDSRTTSGDATYNIPGLGSKTCVDGALCTLIASRGYNRACNDLTSQRAVQREVVVQY